MDILYREKVLYMLTILIDKDRGTIKNGVFNKMSNTNNTEWYGAD